MSTATITRPATDPTTRSAAPDHATRPAPSALRNGPRPGTAAAAVLSLTRTSLLEFVREPVGFVMQYLYPLFMLAIFHAVFPGEVAPGVTYAQYLLPAMITTGVLTTCFQNLAITVAGERESGALRRLAVQPVPAAAHVLAKCLSNTLLAVSNATLLLAVGHLWLGTDMPDGSRAWGLLVATTALMVAASTALGLAIGRLRPSARAASGLVTPIVLVLQFVSGIFFPLAQLPSWMVHVFSVLPVRWSAELMRESLLPGTFQLVEPTGSWETGKGLLIVTAWLVLGVIAAMVATRRDTVDR